jgi:hypothetical protein
MNSIIWEKWRDPFRPLLKRGKLAKQFRQEEDSHDPEFHKARNSFSEDSDERPNPYYEGNIRGETGLVLYGPQGIVPLHESNIPSKLYNFWMGHTNFRISRRIANIIKRVDGVEGLDVFSPYRFRLAIGRHFEQKTVMKAIDESVKDRPKKPVSNQPDLEKTKDRLSKTFPFWAIGMFPDGRRRCMGASTQDAVEEMVNSSRDKYESVIVSWDKE